MTTKSKIFIPLICILSTISIASFSYVMVSHAINPNSNNIEAVDFTSLDTPLTFNQSFGEINPGDTFSQSFMLTKKVSIDVKYHVSFNSDDKSDVFNYIYVTANIDSDTIEKKSLSSLFNEEKYFSRQLNSNKSEKVTFNYLLDIDTPNSIYGDFSFNVVFDIGV